MSQLGLILIGWCALEFNTFLKITIFANKLLTAYPLDLIITVLMRHLH